MQDLARHRKRDGRRRLRRGRRPLRHWLTGPYTRKAGPGAPSRAGPAAAGMDEEMSTISDAVVDDLTFDPDVDASGILVEDGDGDVELTGSVPSYPQYVEAAAVVSRVPGVKSV